MNEGMKGAEKNQRKNIRILQYEKFLEKLITFFFYSYEVMYSAKESSDKRF